MIPKNPPLRDPGYLKHIREHERCVITGQRSPDPAHIRQGFHGMGIKPPDNRVIPLCHEEHMRQHQVGEVTYWREAFRKNPGFAIECLLAYAEKCYRLHKGES